MGFFFNMFLVFILGIFMEKALHLLRDRVRFLYSILNVFWRLGVIFHELSHFIIARMLWVPVKWENVDFHTDGGGGVVKFDTNDPEYCRRITFLKELLLCVAPLWVGTWAIMELYNMYVNNTLLGFKIISVLLTVIILYAFVPSSADIKKIFNTAFFKPYVFVKQVIFLVLAFLIYNLYFDFFYQLAPIYPYLFEFLILLIIEGSLEITLVVLKFILGIIFSYSNNRTIGFYNNESPEVDEMFPSRRQRRKAKKRSRSELFTLLPDDDETAAQEFAQAMIENNAMMIDIENPDDEQ